jgi:ABC-type branched-subunit amino acid transport system substrate-binding protein
MRANHTPYSLFPALILSFMVLLLGGCQGTGTASPWGGTQTSTAPTTGTPHQTAGTYGVQPAMANAGAAITPPGYTPVKVAILLPLSGPNGALGQAMLQAAQLAIFDIGIENLELVPQDTGDSPQCAQAAATTALNEGAQLILGPLLADSVRAVKTIAASKNVNVVAFSTDSTLAGGNTFIMGFMPQSQVERVVTYAAVKGVRTAAVIAPKDKYGDAVVSAFELQARRSGIQITGRLRFSPDKQMMTEEVKSFVATLPPSQALFLPVGGMQADMLSSTLSFNGLTPDKIKYLGTGLWDDANVASLPGLQGGWFAGPSPRAYEMFESKYKATYGSTPPRLASLAYDATALAAVLTRSGQQRGGVPSFDKASLSNANGFAGMDGIFRFNSSGLVERGLAILEIRQRRIIEVETSPKTFQASPY